MFRKSPHTHAGRWQRLGRGLWLTLLWTAVAGYVLYAASLARTARRATTVGAIRVEVTDSTAHGSLVTEREVRSRLVRNGLRVTGRPLDSVDLTAIERVVCAGGFVDRAAAYLTSDGELRIELSQHRPVLRLLAGGMNSYVTRTGYIFPAPPRSARYVPVVTGEYRPPVPVKYTGTVRDWFDRERQRIDSLVEVLERSKYPHFSAERQNQRRQREVSRMRVKRRWWQFEREEDFEQRVQAKREEKALLLKQYRYQAKCIRADIDRIDREQVRQRQRQKKLEKSYEDFMKLLTFVEFVEKDDFWRSELVQLIAAPAASGALELSLVPRSGRFTIRFGRLERTEEKLDKLLRFYEQGLPAIGWERWREIDVRFADQVVCR